MSINQLFLQVLDHALSDLEFNKKPPVSPCEYIELFDIAEKHKLLPLVFDKLYDTYPHDNAELEMVKKRVHFLVYRQVEKTQAVLDLYKEFKENDIYPMIIKGLVCNLVYPKPDLRISSDEDILVSENEFEKCVEVLNKNGFCHDDTIYETEDHLTFRNFQNITIELHKKLFVKDESFFKKYNDMFSDVFENGIFVNINGVDVKTFDYTQNLLYLILHSMKHFIGSGVGIRQFCDIILFADKYGEYIDWDKLFTACKSVNAEYYTAAIFKIGREYLHKNILHFYNNKSFSEIDVDETYLIEDVLSAGIYGKVSRSQALSSASSFSLLKYNNNGILKNIFCSSKNLNDKYNYAKKCPVLLPVAWVHRFFFLMTGKNRHRVDAVFDSMRIGKKRSELFEIYKIKRNVP